MLKGVVMSKHDLEADPEITVGCLDSTIIEVYLNSS